MRRSYRIFRHTCPRDCYSTCSLLSYVRNNALVKVEGDPNHGYTMGRLCADGYGFTRQVYHPERLRYPLRQVPRHSGRWQRIDWETVISIIAEQILDLNQRYGSNLSLGYYHNGRQTGLQIRSVENFFQSIGSYTCLRGGLKARPGYRAQQQDFGKVAMPDPENMAKAKFIVLWGVNPLTKGVHQWFFINRARDLGGQLVVIDKDLTVTGAHADLFFQVKPGSDEYLALALCKVLLEEGTIDEELVGTKANRWPEFRGYVTKQISLAKAAEITGLPPGAIKELAGIFRQRPVAVWVGDGLDREPQGLKTVRAIDTLCFITGQVLFPAGGVYYANPKDWFSFTFVETKSQPIRAVHEAGFPEEAVKLQDPPLKFLWITGCDPLASPAEKDKWFKLWPQLELVVTVDLFMTETAAHSDLVLPGASFFEDYDLHASNWHNWVSINEKAIPNFHEGKSHLEIMRLLAAKLNQFSPGFSTFPSEFSSLDLIRKGLNPEIRRLLGISHWRELLKGPRRLNVKSSPWSDGIFLTPSRKFELYLPGGGEETAICSKGTVSCLM